LVSNVKPQGLRFRKWCSFLCRNGSVRLLSIKLTPRLCHTTLHMTLLAGEDAAEDDGYLVAFVYDEAKDKSDFVVYDAKTMSSTPLATVPLPVRVPHGFHGLWVGEQELKGAE